MRPVTCTIQERRFKQLGYFARLSESDFLYHLLLSEDPDRMTARVNRQYASWLRQIRKYLTRMGTDCDTARRVALDDLSRQRQMVNAATLCNGTSPTLLYLYKKPGLCGIFCGSSWDGRGNCHEQDLNLKYYGSGLNSTFYPELFSFCHFPQHRITSYQHCSCGSCLVPGQS